MSEVIESIDDLLDEWEVIGVSPMSVFLCATGEVAQLQISALNIWGFYDIDTGEQLDQVSITSEHFPLTVVARCDGTEPPWSDDRFRERALAKFFHELEGGPPVLSDGAL